MAVLLVTAAGYCRASHLVSGLGYGGDTPFSPAADKPFTLLCANVLLLD